MSDQIANRAVRRLIKSEIKSGSPDSRTVRVLRPKASMSALSAHQAQQALQNSAAGAVKIGRSPSTGRSPVYNGLELKNTVRSTSSIYQHHGGFSLPSDAGQAFYLLELKAAGPSLRPFLVLLVP